MSRWLGILVSVMVAAYLHGQKTMDTETGLETLKKQFLAVEQAGQTINPVFVKAMIDLQREDGGWPDVDYADRNRSNWKTMRHVGNVAYLARSWVNTHDGATELAFHRGLRFWLDKNITNPNWWWNEINVPQALALAGLNAEPCMSETERSDLCNYLKVSKMGNMTGQNRVWMARIIMMRGLLARDAALVKQAVDTISEELRMTNSEGIRQDWCFHQHGRQPQLGNYGLSFIHSMTRYAQILRGTPFEFSKEKMNLLHHLLKDGYAWIVWNNYMDVSCMGRLLWQNRQRDNGNSARMSISRLRSIGYDIPEDGPWGFKYFYKSAYAVYRSKEPGWMASVRMSTPEVIGVETWVNGDAPNAGHMADGALLVYSTGKEYENIFPLWNNWRLIPGITTYLNVPPVHIPPLGINRGANEANDIAVADSDGRTELSFLLKRDGLMARKTWIFTPDCVVATGEGIMATLEKAEVITCVEQSLAQPNVMIYPYEQGCLRAVNGDFEYRIEAPETAIVAAVEERSGKPSSVMPGTSDTVVTGKVFSVYIRHGVKPLDASYRYAIRRIPR